MRDYIYLDVDFLESYIAQQEDGLNVFTLQDDSTLSTKEGIEDIIWQAEIEGKLKNAIFKSAPTDKDTRIIKSVLLKKQFENMFNKFLKNQLNHEISVNQIDKCLIGEYVCLNGYFDFVSLSRIESLLNLDLLKLRKNISNSSVSNDYIEQLSENFQNIKILFPFDNFLTSNRAIVLLNEKHLLEEKRQIGFKFKSNNISVVGKVNKYTNEIRKDSARINQTLDGIQNLTLSLLKELGIIREEDSEMFLIQPIAIYS